LKRIIDFSSYSSIKVGPKVEVEMIEEVDKSFDEKFFLVGGANNLLLSPSPPPLAKLSKEFDYIKLEGDTLVIGGATPTGKVLSFCKRNDLGGFEFLAKLPGTVGGAVRMNAGVKEYEIKDILLWVKSAEGIKEARELNLEYRKTNISTIVYEAGFKVQKGFNHSLLKKLLSLRSNQPTQPSAGSVFKNPPNDFAGRLIEEVGLKGKRFGNMAFSHQHANFLVNLGGGSFAEAITLIELAKKRVYEKFGVKLEEEVIIL